MASRLHWPTARDRTAGPEPPDEAAAPRNRIQGYRRGPRQPLRRRWRSSGRRKAMLLQEKHREDHIGNPGQGVVE
jgi:hypothetical protein